METKLDSRQGQFPATFPDTFKDFFAIMSEDEDHLDLFSNLLEDKMIPRAHKFNQRRCGGSLRCTSSSSHSNATTAGGGSGGGGGGGSQSHNVGRSNSFRVNRTRATIGSSNMGIGAATAAKSSNLSGSGNLIGGVGSGGGSVTASFCKHIKYCCLHQQQQHQQQQHQLPPSHHNSNQQLFQQHYTQQNVHDYGCSGGGATATRLGPDGEDDNSCSQVAALAAEASNGHNAQQMQQHQQQISKQHQQQQKRHSIILERAFDFDVSCDESDTISTTSSTPTANPTTSTIPYSMLTRPPPILKQPQHHSMQQQQQQQQQHSMPKEVHRTLPQPPKGVGFGAFHTKETALQRIQQQCGLIGGSKTNLAALGATLGASSNNLSGAAAATATGTASVVTSNNYDNYNNISNTDPTVIGGSGGGSGVGNSWSNAPGSGRNKSHLYMDLHSPTATPSPPLGTTTGGAPTGTITTTTMPVGATLQHSTTMNNKFNDLLSSGGATTLSRNNLGSIRLQKSPILNRRRSSSIAANLLTADISFNRNSLATAAGTEEDHSSHVHNHATIPHSNTRDRLSHAKSPVGNKPNRIPIESGVLTFQQAMSGAVSPQYSATSPSMHPTTGHDMSCLIGSNMTMAALLEGTTETTTQSATATTTSGGGGAGSIDSPTAESPTEKLYGKNGYMGGAAGGSEVAGRGFLCGSSATIAQLGNKQRQRLRTSSMPAESRKPRLADTRRAAIHCADIDLDYYRLRSFSITSHGVCNLGDSLRSRRSRSINSVTSTGTSNSGKDRHNSNASRTSGDIIFEQPDKRDPTKGQIPAYKIAMLGASGVGKTTLTYQFTTSDYICAYDLSLDDDYGQKTVSVLVDGIETDLEVIDHPACEMSTEAFCSTYNIDLFVVVYSVVDRSSLKAAEKVLQYLKENEMLLTRGAILVGNKTDLERHREVNRHMGRKVAKEINCKFIETSSGLDHNVDELLVGIVAQVKLNPQRIGNLSERDRQRLNLQSTIQKHRRMHMPSRRMIRQVSMCQADDEAGDDGDGDDAEGYDDDDDGGDFDDMERDENQPHYNNINNNNNLMTLSSTGDEGIGTGSERTASTSLSSSTTTRTSKGPIRKTNKRTLNLESILKMGESEIEDEEDIAARHKPQQQQQQQQHRPLSKFELLTSGKSGSSAVGAGRVRTPFGSLNSSPKSRHSYESNSGGSGAGAGGGGAHNRDSVRSVSGAVGGSRFRDSPSQAEENLLPDCNRRTVSKFTNRTRMFLSSVLRFKKAINVKRRNSSSCSDLFVI